MFFKFVLCSAHEKQKRQSKLFPESLGTNRLVTFFKVVEIFAEILNNN